MLRTTLSLRKRMGRARGTRFALCPGEPIEVMAVILQTLNILVVARTPPSSRVKQKMVYASSRDALRKSLSGIHLDIQGTDKDEVSYETGAASALLFSVYVLITSC